MIFESSFKLSELRKQGFTNMNEWIENPNNRLRWNKRTIY